MHNLRHLIKDVVFDSLMINWARLKAFDWCCWNFRCYIEMLLMLGTVIRQNERKTPFTEVLFNCAFHCRIALTWLIIWMNWGRDVLRHTLESFKAWRVMQTRSMVGSLHSFFNVDTVQLYGWHSTLSLCFTVMWLCFGLLEIIFWPHKLKKTDEICTIAVIVFPMRTILVDGWM